MKTDGFDIQLFKKRIRFVLAWRGGAFGAAAGALVAVCLAVADFFRWIETTPLALLGIVTGGFIIGALLGWFRRVTEDQVGASVDRRAGLKDRLTTALSPGSSEFHGAARQDATLRMEGVSARKLYPIRLTKTHLIAAGVCLLAGGLLYLDRSQILLGSSEKDKRAELKTMGKALEHIAAPTLADKGVEETAELKQTARDVAKLGNELTKARLDSSFAMQEMNRQAAQAERTTQNELEKMTAHQSAAEKILQQSALDEMKKAGKETMSPENAPMTQEQMDQAENDASNATADLTSALDKASKAGGKDSQKLKDLSKKIKDLADKLKAARDAGKDSDDPETKKLQEQLDSTLNEIQNNKLPNIDMKMTKEMQEFAKKLSEAMKGLKFGPEYQKFMQRLMANPEMKKLIEKMKQMAKDQAKLAEMQKQLKDGAPKFTQKDIDDLRKQFEEQIKELEKMAKSATDEDIKKMIDEAMLSLKAGCST